MGLLAARPLASLSSGLLARKGQARPAMRSQGLVSFADAAPLDDLGWNDLGTDLPSAAASPMADVAGPETTAPDVPPVLVERAALRREVEVDAPPAANRGPRAAFTLRLDPHRHLRLRLASASANRSAQQLLIQALDALLAGLPDVERLATQLPRPDQAA